MNFSRVLAVPLRYWYLIYGYPQRTMQIFVWGTFDVLLWGFVTKYLGTLGEPEVNFTALLLGALIFWQFITRIQQSFITIFFEDIWSRNLFNIFASPMSVPEYLLGVVIASSVTSTAAFTFGASVAVLVFGLPLPAISISLLVLVLILVLFGISLGIFSASLVLRLGPSAEWFAWPIPAVMQPFVGVFYPIAILPGAAQWISYALPPSYVFEGLRAIFSGHGIDWTLSLFALALSAAYLCLAGYIFVRTYRWALRMGAIARYSAESFS